MVYNFVKFEGRNSRFESRITITGAYSIGFPTTFYKDNNIQNFKYVVLFWDVASKALGIQFTNDEVEKNKFRIVKTQKYGATFSAKSFFSTNKIDPKEVKGRYEWEKVEQPGIGEIFVINLSNKEKEK